LGQLFVVLALMLIFSLFF